MAKQYDVVEIAGTPAVLIQSDLLDQTVTCVVIPLVPLARATPAIAHLNPTVHVGRRAYILDTLAVASVPRRLFGQLLGTLRNERDLITRAVDALTSGI